MERSSHIYQTYVEILRRELICAMGCTEPVAIAYCAAKARAILGVLPERMEVCASGNVIKNVKSVVVPGTNGRRGIAAAAAVGALGGDETAELEVISHVSDEAKERLADYLAVTPVKVIPSKSERVLDIAVTVFAAGHSAAVCIADEHSNIVRIERDGAVLFEKREPAVAAPESGPDYSLLTVEGICDFAATCELEDVAPILRRQIALNSAIAEEGLENSYGANIGKVLLTTGNDVRTHAKARAAAASDARMNGCEMPVIINSGSGNQGITTSVPVIVFARERGASEEELLRALTVSNLVTIHLKTGIGRLSAYCGAVSAGAGAASGIAYLQGGRFETIAHVIVNTVAVTSGIVCDGAKASCAAKIAAAVDAGLLGLAMVRDGNEFYGGDGIVKKGVENTIAIVGRLARNGMLETDREIIRLMLE